MKVNLDLKRIALRAKNTEYNPKRFHALIMRSRIPKTTALVFKSGKMVCTGAKNEIESRSGVEKFIKIIRQIGFYEAKMKDYNIRNIVATVNFKMPIRLDTILYAFRVNCMYEPEIFPGLIYRPNDSRVVVIFFMTGKVVITGSKSTEELNHAYNSVLKIILELQNLA